MPTCRQCVARKLPRDHPTNPECLSKIPAAQMTAVSKVAASLAPMECYIEVRNRRVLQEKRPTRPTRNDSTLALLKCAPQVCARADRPLAADRWSENNVCFARAGTNKCARSLLAQSHKLSAVPYDRQKTSSLHNCRQCCARPKNRLRSRPRRRQFRAKLHKQNCRAFGGSRSQ